MHIVQEQPPLQSRSPFAIHASARTFSQAALVNADDAVHCKRQRQEQQQQEVIDDDYDMEVDEATAPVSQPLVIPDKDEILIQMLLANGATTYDQVVDFCISCNIPISRMLQLDLLRVIQEKLPSDFTMA